MNYCSECGHKLTESEKFCGECGNKIEGIEHSLKGHEPNKEIVREEAPKQYNAIPEDLPTSPRPKKKSKMFFSLLIVVVVVFGGLMILGGQDTEYPIDDKVVVDNQDRQINQDIKMNDSEGDVELVIDDSASQGPSSVLIPESQLIETASVGQHITDDGKVRLSLLGLYNRHLMDASKLITDEMILWEYETFMPTDELTELDPISGPRLTIKKNVAIEIRGNLYYFHGDTGDILWQAPLAGSGAYIAAGFDELIFVACYYGDFLKCYTESGDLLWTIKESEDLYWPNHISLKEGLINVHFGEENKIAKFDTNGEFLAYAEEIKLDEEVVYFHDPAFERAFRDVHNLGDGVLRVSDLEKIQVLDFKNNSYAEEISSLDDLIYFKKLRTLRISGKADAILQVDSDIAVLKDLKDLEYLSLVAMTLKGDLSALNCSEIERLYIEGTDVTGDLKVLTKFTKLKNLGLSHSQIAGNIDWLSGLENLETLYLHNSKSFGDIQSLSKLFKLKKLNVGDSDIGGDSELLENLPLEEFYFQNSNVY